MAKQSTQQKQTVGRVMSGRQNRRQYARTKSKERRGQTAQQKEGRRAVQRTAAHGGRRNGPTRAQLYRAAARRKIPGRSSMNKAQLQRALRR
jgi:DNA end-binding protein Ku